MRTTKIVATLGPASSGEETVRGLFEAGVDVFRLNASHGTEQERAARARTVREVGEALGRHAGILLDLQGPKIRLGAFEGGGCELKTGARFVITVEPVLGTQQRASTTYAGFAADVRPGNRVMLNDGAVELRAISSDGVSVEFEVVSGGWISDRKGINLPGVRVSSPALTRKDLADLRSGLQAGIDFVALSFVRGRDDLLRLRLYLEELEARVPVIAKLEKPEAWERLDEILEESDGVMVARGDLGVEMPPEKVPFIQKAMIRRARERGRFVITATQMLESMIQNPLPTRAEVSDVANAIYDGTDAVMLSAETSAGLHPVGAARMMARIAAEADRSRAPAETGTLPREGEPAHAEIIAGACWRAACSGGVRAVAVFTTSGSSARLIARYRPKTPVYAFTPDAAVARQLSVVHGIRPIVSPPAASIDEMLACVERLLVERGLAQAGDSVAFVAGQPVGRPGTTNFLKLHRLGGG